MDSKKFDSLIETIKSVTSNTHGKKFDFPVEFTFSHLLERIYNNLIALKHLKEDFLKYEHGIGLIARNLLTDFITMGYVIKISGKRQEVIGSLYSLYNSDMLKADNFMKMKESAGEIDVAEMNKYMDRYNQKSIYKDVRDYATINNIKGLPQIAQMITALNNSGKKDMWTQEIVHSYDLWLFYSKYEHVGWYSYDLTRSISKQNIEERLNSVLRKTLILICGCLDELKEENAYKKCNELMVEQYKEFQKTS